MKKQTFKNLFYRIITICLIGFFLYGEIPFVSFPDTGNNTDNQISICNDDDKYSEDFNY